MRPGTPQLVTAFILACIAGSLTPGAAASGESSAPFCGIYSLYTALRAEGSNVKLSNLINPRYIGSPSGSTMSELYLAAQEQGAHVEVLTNLGVADLRHLSCPAILHVKSEYDALEYNHYVLCVPAADGRLLLYDPPDPPTRTSGAELAALWDGTALLVSARPIALGSLRRWATFRVFLAVVLGLAVLAPPALLLSGKKSRLRRVAVSTQCLLLLSGATVIAAAYHLAAPQGFVAQQEAVTAIRNAHFLEPPGRIELSQARLLWRQGAKFIDARGAVDFDEGHVPGAINVSPNSSRSDRRRVLSGFDRNIRLVVYCQSPACPYASLLAKRLVRDGFLDVRVLVGGFDEWSNSSDRLHQPPAVLAAEETP